MGNCVERTGEFKVSTEPVNTFAANLTRDLKGQRVSKFYDYEHVLGVGSMGSVSLVRRKQSTRRLSITEQKEGASSKSGQYYAIKTIHEDRITPEFIEELKNEIDILKSLDHPNIVKAYEVFYCKRRIHIAMEYCSGGNLFKRTPYTETESAEIVRKLLSAVKYMHDNGVVHRDLKYENILFENDSPEAEIKVIDFGLSKKYEPGEVLRENVGTIYTMAPEVFRGVYSSQADMWSVGVIAFMLLSTSKPFHHKKRKVVKRKIKKADYNLMKETWFAISEEAKLFVSSLLVLSPEKRLSAEEAFQSSWLQKEYAFLHSKSDLKLKMKIRHSFSDYGAYSEFKKMALMIMAHKTSSEEIMELRKIYSEYDTSGDGCINVEEFKAGLSSFECTEEELEEMFHNIDLDGNGLILYTEFIAATLEAQGLIEEERLIDAFESLDIDNDGFITSDELRLALGTDYTAEKLESILKDVDENNDGKITYEEFLTAFRKEKTKEIAHVCEDDGDECFCSDDESKQ